jgi:hypothetical protein
MGAWGAGLQANDTALDAISYVEEEIGRRSIKYLVKEKGVGFLLKIAAQADGDYSRHGILGVAEWLVDQGIDVSKNSSVMDAIKFEKDEERISCWKDRSDRLKVLELFELRITKGITAEQQREIDESNMGLFACMQKRLSEK